MNGNFHLMALTGIGSLKHHVLSTKRAGFIFIFIVQTIKTGVDVKQHPFDMRDVKNNFGLHPHGLGSYFSLTAMCSAQVGEESVQT